ncbi:MAG TPA: hypothetical protein VN672_05970 [Solirubrobacteraceae bacterium]|nr:hypothetical protein [Solirubrobacteraceae bacterium]
MPPDRLDAVGCRLPVPSASRPLASVAVLACAITLSFAATAEGKITTFGSTLSTPATLDTAHDLSYRGTDTSVPPSPEAPNGVVHTYHFGADGVLWNLNLANGAARAPATGQALKVALEGCAVPAADGTPPLTEIHFQALTPQPGGGAKINITSQPFDIPVCGVGGASGSTVSTYEPTNLCVSAGDFVGFNEEGGFVGHSYQSGVPYRVLARVPGSTVGSFIRGGGTNNGTLISPQDTSAMDGFARTQDEELMLRVTLGTDGDATHVCPGGKRGLPPVLAPIRISPQTDGVNHSRIVAVAMFCRVSPCNGVATLGSNGGELSGYGRSDTYGRVGFSLPANKTVHLAIRVKAKLLRQIRAKHGVSTILTAVVNGKTVSQRITVKIL